MGSDHKTFRRWFGRDGPTERKEARRVLNSVSSMLSNVVYRVRSPDCADNTYAFVYPSGPDSRSKDGKFPFYLCPLYFKVDESEQIETLTHEGSHHATAYTDDVCADSAPQGSCRKAYGRRVCEEVARTYPRRAIMNADNYCYYINDLNQ